MLRRRLVLFYHIHLCQRLDERLEGGWDIQGSKHTKSVYPALLPLEILGFANKGHIALCRVQDSGTAVGGGGFRCHLRRDLHTLVSKVQKYSLGYRKQYANYTDGYKHASRCGYVVLKWVMGFIAVFSITFLCVTFFHKSNRGWYSRKTSIPKRMCPTGPYWHPKAVGMVSAV